MDNILRIFQQYHIHIAFIIAIIIILTVVKNNDITSFLRFLFHESNSFHRALRIYEKLPDSASREIWKNHTEALATKKLFGKYISCKDDRKTMAQFYQATSGIKIYKIKRIAYKIYFTDAGNLAIKNYNASDKRSAMLNRFSGLLFLLLTLTCWSYSSINITEYLLRIPFKPLFPFSTTYMAILGAIAFVLGMSLFRNPSIKEDHDEVKKLIEQFNKVEKDK